MELIKVPTADGDIHDDWKDIAEIAKLINALGDLKIVMSQVRNKLTLTTGSATLELMLGGGTGTAITYPWQPYLSSWTGSGTDPFAATRASRFRLRRGKFAGRTPANMSDEFVAFGDLTDATITEENAVVTQVYLSAPVTETTLGQGDATYAIPTIMVVQGADLLTALGTTLPNTGEDGGAARQSDRAHLRGVDLGRRAAFRARLFVLPRCGALGDERLPVRDAPDHAGRDHPTGMTP